MELSAELDSGVDLGRYKTPLRKLARRLKAGVELWKAKYHALKRDLKRYQNRAADAQRSRDRWKEQARGWKASAEQLQAELDRLREATAVSEKKKTTISEP